MGDTEEYFPRGGKKPTVTHFKQSSNFLGAPERGERKKKKVKTRPENDDGYLSDENLKDISTSYTNCAFGISYNTMKEGMLLLGRVQYVMETKVSVVLPGKTWGTVMACHISEPYNRLLEAYVNDQTEKVMELPQMFRVGQYVAVKVLEVSKSNSMLSMMPQHINGAKTHSDIHKGMLLQAAVSSVEDHGYMMDIGIPAVRAFLPKKNANPEMELDTGMITWCCVKSLSPSSDNSVVTVSNELPALQNAVQRKSTTTPLLPATAFEFTVDKPLDNGIEGHIFDDVTSYVQRQHADTVKGKKPMLGQKIRARLLYVMPIRNTPFLTMRNIFETTYPSLEEEQKFKEGDIIEDAQVMYVVGKSIYFKLGVGCVGTMSLKRVKVDEELAERDVIAKLYPTCSIHKVRVLKYHPLDYRYTVTDESRLLDERYFSLNELQVGQLVDGTVQVVKEDYLLVKVGRITGFVPRNHQTDAGLCHDPKSGTISHLTKKKFKVDQKLKARVLDMDVVKQSFFLTLKPSLLAPELEVLSSYGQAEIGKAYTGVIKVIRDYLLVQFFAKVTAYVPKVYVCKEPVDNFETIFHVGQIVRCTILRVDVERERMTGSLTTEPFWPEKKREKRKQHTDHKDEVPRKKRKSDDDDEQTETESKKEKDKKHKKKSLENVTNEENLKEFDTKEDKLKKKKKKNTPAEDETEREIKNVSEESDAIETDIHEDSVEILSPQEKMLVDISTCVDLKRYRKRVACLTRAVNARLRRMDRVDQKIARIEKKGLDAENKRFHTAMHTEKLVLVERIKLLMEALNTVQSKLKEFNLEDVEDHRKKNKKKKKEPVVKEKKVAVETEVENKVEKEREEVAVETEVKKKKEKKKKDKMKKEKDGKGEKKNKIKEIQVVESLKPALEVPSVKDFWSGSADCSSKSVQEEDSSSSDDEKQEQPKKKRKKLTVAEKVAKAREEEERLREMERRAIESEAQPRSSEQFERALLANPDCSQLWIAYMAFHLQATEIDKARAVGRKALDTISFREELEKLNVWLALLNLEHRFGTKESQQKTLEEALQMNEKFKVHSKLLDIYVETSKHQELSSLVDLMMKKYKQPETYIMCGTACFKLGLVDKARQVMQKAVNVLEKKEHVSVLTQFALLERAHGGRERAEALFEQVLAVYPQRVDVCSVYVDMLVKSGDVDQVRQVMERMTSQKLPARKMKVLYRKWVEVEEKIGDPEQVESIRKRAVEYLDKAKF